MILLGFVLPSFTVSCSVLQTTNQSLSLIDLAGLYDLPYRQTTLYLIPFGMMVVFTLSFLQPRNRGQAIDILLGQYIVIGIGILSLIAALFTFLTMITQFKDGSIIPQFGIVFIAGGYLILFLGLVLEWLYINQLASTSTQNYQSEKSRPGKEGAGRAPYHSNKVVISSPPPPPTSRLSPTATATRTAQRTSAVLPTSKPRLELLKGAQALPATIPLPNRSLTIGRGRGNDLQLLDISVSRQHAQLRFAQGMWFIQDKGSTCGTQVNDRGIEAARLNSGDTVTIGRNYFVFKN